MIDERKTCRRCGQEKSRADFYEQADRKSGASYCKSCFNQYCVERWISKKKQAIAYKGGRCCRCGYDRHYAALQFHHLDPRQKDVSWAKLRLRSWTKIRAELDKCELLCANCHAVEHAR